MVPFIVLPCDGGIAIEKLADIRALRTTTGGDDIGRGAIHFERQPKHVAKPVDIPLRKPALLAAHAGRIGLDPAGNGDRVGHHVEQCGLRKSLTAAIEPHTAADHAADRRIGDHETTGGNKVIGIGRRIIGERSSCLFHLPPCQRWRRHVIGQPVRREQHKVFQLQRFPPVRREPPKVFHVHKAFHVFGHDIDGQQTHNSYKTYTCHRLHCTAL